MTSVFPYVFNILVLVPVAPLTLFGGVGGMCRVSQGRFPDSPGIRMIVGSMWMALLVTSMLGLYFPRTFAPILLVQMLYKALWLLVFALPRLIGRRVQEIPPGIAITFAVIVVSYPWAVDWRQLFGGG
jgi:hypothetical protein